MNNSKFLYFSMSVCLATISKLGRQTVRKSFQASSNVPHLKSRHSWTCFLMYLTSWFKAQPKARWLVTNCLDGKWCLRSASFIPSFLTTNGFARATSPMYWLQTQSTLTTGTITQLVKLETSVSASTRRFGRFLATPLSNSSIFCCLVLV